MSRPAGTHTARDVLVDRAARDVEDTLARLRERLAAQRGGLVRGLEVGVLSLVRLLDPRGRIARDLDRLLAVAARLEAGEDPAALARAHVEEVLDMWALNLVARVRDPSFRPALDVAERIFRDRLPDLARMARVEAPRDYPDLVRRAFPERARVDAIVDENGREVLALIDHVAAHPHLLRLPRAWVVKLVPLAREMVAWKLDEVRRELDDIYA